MRNNIQKVLNEKNMTIAELGRRTGLHYGHLYGVVTKEDLSEVQIKTLKKIAEALEVNVDDLFYF